MNVLIAILATTFTVSSHDVGSAWTYPNGIDGANISHAEIEEVFATNKLTLTKKRAAIFEGVYDGFAERYLSANSRDWVSGSNLKNAVCEGDPYCEDPSRRNTSSMGVDIQDAGSNTVSYATGLVPINRGGSAWLSPYSKYEFSIPRQTGEVTNNLDGILETLEESICGNSPKKYFLKTELFDPLASYNENLAIETTPRDPGEEDWGYFKQTLLGENCAPSSDGKTIAMGGRYESIAKLAVCDTQCDARVSPIVVSNEYWNQTHENMIFGDGDGDLMFGWNDQKHTWVGMMPSWNIETSVTNIIYATNQLVASDIALMQMRNVISSGYASAFVYWPLFISYRTDMVWMYDYYIVSTLTTEEGGGYSLNYTDDGKIIDVGGGYYDFEWTSGGSESSVSFFSDCGVSSMSASTFRSVKAITPVSVVASDVWFPDCRDIWHDSYIADINLVQSRGYSEGCPWPEEPVETFWGDTFNWNSEEMGYIKYSFSGNGSQGALPNSIARNNASVDVNELKQKFSEDRGEMRDYIYAKQSETQSYYNAMRATVADLEEEDFEGLTPVLYSDIVVCRGGNVLYVKAENERYYRKITKEDPVGYAWAAFGLDEEKTPSFPEWNKPNWWQGFCTWTWALTTKWNPHNFRLTKHEE